LEKFFAKARNAPFLRRYRMSIEDLTKDQQFQAFALRRTLDHKALDPAKMLMDFTVKVLVESIAAVSNERRADLVQKSTGIKRKSALRMSIEESIKAIDLALSEGDTTADEIFDDKEDPRGVSEGEIIRFFPPDRVYRTWYNSGFVVAASAGDQAVMADLWDFILEHKLLGDMTALQLVQELGLHHFVSDKCPAEKRKELIETVLQYGEPMLSSSRPDGSSSSANANKSRACTAITLLSVVKPADLVKFIRLTDMAKPIEELAKTKGWIKSDSVIPPSNASDDAEADAAAAEALAASDGEGVEVVLDADGDSAEESPAESNGGERSNQRRRDKSGPPPIRKG